MKLFKCQHCKQLLYFENQRCESCSHRLGYLPESSTLSALDQRGDLWRALAGPARRRYRFCENAELSGCNWLVATDSPERFCTACRHNRTIPDLTITENLTRWRKLEFAKRRMFYSLIRLGLPLANRLDDPAEGLVFDFPAATPALGAQEVVTGVITINLKEADDAEREKLRHAMGETYRTLLGHFRHEIGHYFWDRLVRDGGRVERFRQFFGDERRDYGEALQAHYAAGPPPDWPAHYITHYASAHPWEDFAETWAHYLHIVDTLEMACAFRLRVQSATGSRTDLRATLNFDPYQATEVDNLIQAWLPLAIAVNGINRCMGEPDLYPFILSPAVIPKLGFVHELVHENQNLTVSRDSLVSVSG